jgi:hypothetical protein
MTVLPALLAAFKESIGLPARRSAVLLATALVARGVPRQVLLETFDQARPRAMPSDRHSRLPCCHRQILPLLLQSLAEKLEPLRASALVTVARLVRSLPARRSTPPAPQRGALHRCATLRAPWSRMWTRWSPPCWTSRHTRPTARPWCRGAVRMAHRRAWLTAAVLRRAGRAAERAGVSRAYHHHDLPQVVPAQEHGVRRASALTCLPPTEPGCIGRSSPGWRPRLTIPSVRCGSAPLRRGMLGTRKPQARYAHRRLLSTRAQVSARRHGLARRVPTRPRAWPQGSPAPPESQACPSCRRRRGAEAWRAHCPAPAPVCTRCGTCPRAPARPGAAWPVRAWARGWSRAIQRRAAVITCGFSLAKSKTRKPCMVALLEMRLR